MSECYDPYPIFKDKYPELFRDDYFISFGFGKGWEEIVTKLMDVVREENNKLGVFDNKIHVVQVKEKFGGLRFYTDSLTDALAISIRHYEKEANKTCEMCGSKENVTTKGSWLKSYCEECHSKNNLP